MALSGGVRTICGMLWQVLVLRKDTRRFYDAFAGQYDALVGGQPDAEGIARFVADSWPGADSEAGPLLELGCGTGLLTAHLVSAGLPVVGVDFSRGQLAVLQGKDLPVPLVQGDVLALPFRDSVFGAAVGMEVMAHLPGREIAYIAEVHRVLSPGGCFFLDPLPLRPTPKKRSARISRRLVFALRTAVVKLSRIDSWTALPPVDTLTAAMEAAGFQVQAAELTLSRPYAFIIGRKPIGSSADGTQDGTAAVNGRYRPAPPGTG